MKKRNNISSLKMPELAQGDRWIDDYELMEGFHLSKDTVEEWQNEGLPRYSIRRKTYYKESELNTFIEKHRIPKLPTKK